MSEIVRETVANASVEVLQDGSIVIEIETGVGKKILLTISGDTSEFIMNRLIEVFGVRQE